MKKDIGNGYMFIINSEVQILTMKGSILLLSLVKLEEENFPNPDVTILQIHILYRSGIKTILFSPGSYSFSFDLMYIHFVTLTLLQHSAFCFAILPVNFRVATVISLMKTPLLLSWLMYWFP